MKAANNIHYFFILYNVIYVYQGFGSAIFYPVNADNWNMDPHRDTIQFKISTKEIYQTLLNKTNKSLNLCGNLP